MAYLMPEHHQEKRAKERLLLQAPSKEQQGPAQTQIMLRWSAALAGERSDGWACVCPELTMTGVPFFFFFSIQAIDYFGGYSA